MLSCASVQAIKDVEQVYKAKMKQKPGRMAC